MHPRRRSRGRARGWRRLRARHQLIARLSLERYIPNERRPIVGATKGNVGGLSATAQPLADLSRATDVITGSHVDSLPDLLVGR